MRSVPIIMVALLALIMPGAAFGQYPTADVTFESESGSQATFLSISTSQKSKNAEKDAIEGAFNVLIHDGVDGFHDGHAIMSGESKSFDYRFFTQQIYNRYLVGKPVKVADRKINGVKQVEVRLTINIKGLVKEVQGGATLSPAWADKKAQPKATVALNPTVIVVPYIKGDGDDGFAAMKSLMDNSPAYSGAVNELSNLFAKKGYKTRDLKAALRNAKTSSLLNEDAQDDNKSLVVRNLPGDIVVSVEINVKSAGGKSSCALNINAVENQTEGALGGVSYASGTYNTTDTAALVKHALGKVEDRFFADVQQQFENMVKNGRSMAIEFNLGSTVADWDFDSPTPQTDEDFKQVLEDWLADNSFQGVYDMGLSSDKFVQATLNIPLWDTERNRGYTTSNFSSALKKFLRQHLGDEYRPSITSMGQKIHVTIQ